MAHSITALGMAAKMLAIGVAVGVAAPTIGCFTVAWRVETQEAAPPEPIPGMRQARPTPIKLRTRYTVSSTDSLANPQGNQLLFRELERHIKAPFEIVREESSKDSIGTMTIACGDPVETMNGASAFAVLFTVGILPGVGSYRLECTAELRDVDGKLIWTQGFQRNYGYVASSLPYVYFVPDSDAAGPGAYGWAKERAAEDVAAFAEKLADRLDVQQVEISSKLRAQGAVSLKASTEAPLAIPSAALPEPAKAEPLGRRLALVIGNSRYSVGPLANPANDAVEVAYKLRELGFDVTLLRNADYRRMESSVRAMTQELGSGGVGLFYFAGHGVQIAGENFLLPVENEFTSENDVRYGSLSASWVVDELHAAGNGVNIVVLDACRDNPFARSFRSASRGLATIRASGGTLLAYSTAPGQVATDGTGANSPYARSLLDAMDAPRLPVELVFKRVGAAVQKETNGAQVPWVSSSLTHDFYFRAR